MPTSKINLFHVIVSCIIGVLNVLLLTSKSQALILVSIEVIVLLILFIKNDITNYLGYYLIFLSLSFEFNYVLGDVGLNIYGFKSFKFFGLNLGILFLIPVFLKLLFKKIELSRIKKKTQMFNFITIIIIFSLTGLIMGLINLAINDNDIFLFPNPLDLFVGELYQGAVFPLLLIGSFIYVYLYEENSIELLVSFIFSILIGSTTSLITSLLAGITGTYGGIPTLLSPMISSLIPFLILFILFESRIKFNILISLMFFISGLTLMIAFNSSGKLFIYLFLLPIILIVNLYKRRHFKKVLIIFVALPILFISAFFYIKNVDNLLLTIKFNQALSLLNIFKSNWLQTLPDSPRFRVSEFINILHEYMSKPWQFLFGKGYLATISDHEGLFDATSKGAFSDTQWQNRTFYAMHSAINTILLSHGLFGILSIIYFIRIILCKLLYSPLGVLGAFWFILYYGYSITLSSVGMISLMIALTDETIRIKSSKSILA